MASDQFNSFGNSELRQELIRQGRGEDRLAGAIMAERISYTLRQARWGLEQLRAHIEESCALDISSVQVHLRDREQVENPGREVNRAEWEKAIQE